MWDLLKEASKEVPEQEKRIADKKLQLENMGRHIDISHIKKPEDITNIPEDTNISMWEKMKLAEQKINAHMVYLNELEKVYDEALVKVKTEGPPSKKEKVKKFTEKKVIIDK